MQAFGVRSQPLNGNGLIKQVACAAITPGLRLMIIEVDPMAGPGRWGDGVSPYGGNGREPDRVSMAGSLDQPGHLVTKYGFGRADVVSSGQQVIGAWHGRPSGGPSG